MAIRGIRGIPAEIHGNDRRSRLGEHGSVDAAAGSCVEHELVRPEEVVQIFARLVSEAVEVPLLPARPRPILVPYEPPIFLHLKAKVASALSSSAKSGTPATIGKRSPESSTRVPSKTSPLRSTCCSSEARAIDRRAEELEKRKLHLPLPEPRRPKEKALKLPELVRTECSRQPNRNDERSHDQALEQKLEHVALQGQKTRGCAGRRKSEHRQHLGRLVRRRVDALPDKKVGKCKAAVGDSCGDGGADHAEAGYQSEVQPT